MASNYHIACHVCGIRKPRREFIFQPDRKLSRKCNDCTRAELNLPGTHRYCGSCYKWLDQSLFSKCRRNVHGFNVVCNACKKDKAFLYRVYMTPEKKAEFSEKARVKARAKWHDGGVERKYGLQIGEYQRMLDAQDGVCFICKRPERVKRNGKVKRLAVDHCHQSGKIRGLLCHHCNIALGQFKEKSSNIHKAIAYLIHHKEIHHG